MRMNWSYYDKDNQLIQPLTYNNKKTQETILNEALETLNNHDVLFIQGGVGTGKSVIVFHLIVHLQEGNNSHLHEGTGESVRLGLLQV